jgi:hypothetical protein
MESNTASKCFLNKTNKKVLLNKKIQNALLAIMKFRNSFRSLSIEPEMMNLFICLF